jgi:hypothetical protein
MQPKRYYHRFRRDQAIDSTIHFTLLLFNGHELFDGHELQRQSGYEKETDEFIF